jgi:hypothetical protein
MASNSKGTAFHVTKCQAAVTTISAWWQFAVAQQAGIIVGLPTYRTGGHPAADVRTITFVWYAAIPAAPRGPLERIPMAAGDGCYLLICTCHRDPS